jgi:hypothetical protein
MELKEVLRWIVSGGGSGIIVYLVMAKIKWPETFPSEAKRYITIASTFVLAAICYALLVWAGYDPVPQNGLEWVEHLWLVGTTAFGLAEMIHATIDLKANDKEKREAQAMETAK